MVARTDAFIRGGHLFPLDFLRIQYIVSPVPYSLALRPLVECQYIYLLIPLQSTYYPSRIPSGLYLVARWDAEGQTPVGIRSLYARTDCSARDNASLTPL